MCIANVAHCEPGASRTRCVVRCPEGALANSRWEASGFMLAHPPDQRAPETRPGRGGGPSPPRPERHDNKGITTPPPLPGRRLCGCGFRWVREHEPARFPPDQARRNPPRQSGGPSPPRVTRQRPHETTAAPCRGGDSVGCGFRWVREHEPARFPPAIRPRASGAPRAIRALDTSWNLWSRRLPHRWRQIAISERAR